MFLSRMLPEEEMREMKLLKNSIGDLKRELSCTAQEEHVTVFTRLFGGSLQPLASKGLSESG